MAKARQLVEQTGDEILASTITAADFPMAQPHVIAAAAAAADTPVVQRLLLDWQIFANFALMTATISPVAAFCLCPQTTATTAAASC